MPRKRRSAKERPAALALWSMVFQTGYNFFDDGADACIVVDNYGRPSVDDVRLTWTELGGDFLHHVAEKDGNRGRYESPARQSGEDVGAS
ncbi:hypothetical protein [Rhizobium leguminosarum]|uniref:hypothetical protein n=1 Tax=Rhizobium leguminosarum TaxID=384 RepID=UPI001440EB42|nr:hypothetical protein [Rhizobium leguminosarum]NKL66284.1 hypothetical protein [Rhizobium leguminosarum bv. viciae]